MIKSMLICGLFLVGCTACQTSPKSEIYERVFFRKCRMMQRGENAYIQACEEKGEIFHEPKQESKPKKANNSSKNQHS